MSSLVFKTPPQPVRDVSKPYRLLDTSEKALDLSFDILKAALISAEDTLRAWRDERNKRLGVKRLIHKIAWRASRKKEDALCAAFNQTYKTWQLVYVKGGYQLRHGKHRWHDGDEEVYNSLIRQRQILSEQVQETLQHIRDSHANEITPAQLDGLIDIVQSVCRETVDILVAFYLRIRPLWKHRTEADLPSPFCPLAIEAQKSPDLRIVPITTPYHSPKQPELSSLQQIFQKEQQLSWICPRCFGLVVSGALSHLKKRYGINSLFEAHLQARVHGEKVKHACPQCFKVFGTLESYEFYHSLDVRSECGDMPPDRLYVGELDLHL